MDAKYAGKDLKQEIERLGIVAMEDFGKGTKESAFAALNAIEEHNKQYSEEVLLKMMETAKQKSAS
jgi:hypothetical protein